MDLSPHNLFDGAPADFLQYDFPHFVDHHHSVDGTFASTSPAQFPGALFAPTQLHAPQPYTLPTALPGNGQHDVESAGDSQSASAALTTPATPMGPPARPRKRKAPTLRADVWEPYKHRILDLHVTQGLPLSEVKRTIEHEYDFKAELRQYRTRISKWNQDKNVKPQEMQAIVRKRQRRKLVETSKNELVFEVRGSQVQPQKIERWMNRHGVPGSFLYATSSAASTPSAVGCHTVSERGSPAMMSAHSPAAFMSPPGTVNFMAQSPQMSSPALSVSSLVRPQDSVFVGQSPALAYRSLPSLYSNSIHIPNTFEIQMDVDTRPRYRQEEEERLREEIFRAETSTETSPSEMLNKLYNLGDVLLRQGRYKSAEEVSRRLVETCQIQGRNGDDDLDTLKAQYLLGQVLQFQGLYVKAERLFRRVLKGRKKALGREHQETLRTVSYLGSVLQEQGKYKEAEVMHRQVLETSGRVRGLEHVDTLIYVRCLGVVLERQGRFKEAEVMHRRALEGQEKVLGLEHQDTLASVGGLGLVLEKQGRFVEAEAMHRRTLESSEKGLGLEHPETLASVNNLGVVLEKQGRFAEAEAMHRRALEGKEKVLGLEHPDTLVSVNNLGMAMRDQGRFAEAEVMHRRALEGKEKVLGLEHPDTLASVNNVGVVLEKQGRFAEAEAMHRRALEGSEKVLGLEHSDTITIAGNLAVVLEKQGRFAEAAAIRQQVRRE